MCHHRSIALHTALHMCCTPSRRGHKWSKLATNPFRQVVDRHVPYPVDKIVEKVLEVPVDVPVPVVETVSVPVETIKTFDVAVPVAEVMEQVRIAVPAHLHALVAWPSLRIPFMGTHCLQDISPDCLPHYSPLFNDK